MKKIHLYLGFITIILILLGCSNETEKSNTECTDTEVPCLIVSGNNKVEAVRGTTSWDTFEADSEAPPKLVSYQEGELDAKLNSKIELQFSEKPLSVKVYQWNDNESKREIKIKKNSFVVDQPGIIVYEVKAKWSEGNAHFAFEINVD